MDQLAIRVKSTLAKKDEIIERLQSDIQNLQMKMQEQQKILNKKRADLLK